LSEAVAVSPTAAPETTAPDAGAVIETVGAVASIETVSEITFEVAEFVAASNARAVKE